MASDMQTGAYRAGVRLVQICIGMLLASTCRGQVHDVALKAAYIYNIAQFTTWPAEHAAKATMNVCASGELAQSLKKLNGKSVDGRTWTLIEYVALTAAIHCDIAVLSGGEGAQHSVFKPGTLLIAHGKTAEKHHPAITLVDDDDHVRFDIDTQEAARQGLKFSSRLLRLARNVQ
jgi:hypothetical protein